MKKILLLILLFFVSLPNLAEEVYTKSGKKVVLKDDFTWYYADEDKSKPTKNPGLPPRILTKTEDMTSYANSKSGIFKIFYNPNQWNIVNEVNEFSEFHFINVGKSGNAMVMFDGVEIPLDVFPGLLILSVNKSDPEARIVHIEDCIVNGAKGKLVTYKAQTKGLKLIFHSFITSNPTGSIQLSTFTLENQFEKEKENFEKLISGLTVK